MPKLWRDGNQKNMKKETTHQRLTPLEVAEIREKAIAGRIINFNGTNLLCREDGSVEWMNARFRRRTRTMGSKCQNGYRYIKISGRHALVSRLIAQAFIEGFEEVLKVDHINGNTDDNRPKNLRMVTVQGNNQAFRRTTIGSSSAYRGVGWDKQTGRWRAKIKTNKTVYNLGRFDCETQAAKTYDAKAAELGFSPESFNFKLND